jgi:dihydropteroate synthase
LNRARRERHQAPTIVAVLNVSPESPNRGSVARTPAEARKLAARYVREGAAIIDVGGRSSSPDSPVVSDGVERERVLPVVEALAADGHIVSIDTWSSATAVAALEAGACVVNFTGRAPSKPLLTAISRRGATLVLSYMPYGDPYRMRTARWRNPSIEEIADYFEERVRVLRPLPDSLVIDPNIGMLTPTMRADRPAAIAWRASIIGRLTVLEPLARPIMLALPRRDGPGATRLWAALILAFGAAYIRTHHPALIGEMWEVRTRLGY